MVTGAEQMKQQPRMYLWQVTLEYASGSEYEHTKRLFYYETTLKKAHKAAEKDLHIEGYRWSEEEKAFKNAELWKSADIKSYVRIDNVEQARFVSVENGTAFDTAVITSQMRYERQSDGYIRVLKPYVDYSSSRI
jgi:hypothetical protein